MSYSIVEPIDAINAANFLQLALANNDNGNDFCDYITSTLNLELPDAKDDLANIVNATVGILSKCPEQGGKIYYDILGDISVNKSPEDEFMNVADAFVGCLNNHESREYGLAQFRKVRSGDYEKEINAQNAEQEKVKIEKDSLKKQAEEAKEREEDEKMKDPEHLRALVEKLTSDKRVLVTQVAGKDKEIESLNKRISSFSHQLGDVTSKYETLLKTPNHGSAGMNNWVRLAIVGLAAFALSLGKEAYDKEAGEEGLGLKELVNSWVQKVKAPSSNKSEAEMQKREIIKEAVPHK